tara:strand:- start:891 stop:1637 length:747 start_codon:yes stop_codon:yes gene_type:complete
MNCHCCENESYILLIEDVYKCNICDHVFINYKYDNTKFHVEIFRDLKGARRDEEEIDESGKITKLFHEKRKEIVSKRAEYVKQYLKKDYECLDIGAGAGTFAREIQHHVKEIECTELTPSLIEECERLGFDTYKDDFSLIDFERKYDVVFAWHVLEHVVDVKQFKEKIEKVMGKYAIIEIPLLVALNGQGRRRNLKTPNGGNFDGHAHYFSEQSFVRLFENEFKILELKEGVQSPALFAALERKNKND